MTGRKLASEVCYYGRVPLASHARCRLCGCLMGCDGEPRPGRDGMCEACARDSRKERQFYLKPTEVARLCGLSRQTVLRLIHSGQLRAALVSRPAGPNGRRYIISRSALAAFLGEDILR